MTDLGTLLCIEDSSVHLADLEDVLQAELLLVPGRLNVLYARDQKAAEILLPKANMVMLNPCFPRLPGHHARSLGTRVIDYCLDEEKSFVWVTHTRRPEKMEALQKWGLNLGFRMFDINFVKQQPGEATDKTADELWRTAFYGLLYLVVGTKMGICGIKNGKIWDLEKDRPYHQRCLNPFAKLGKIIPGQIDDRIVAEMVERGFPHKVFIPPKIVATGDDLKTTSAN